jgi:choline/glycine/proline betaine transport protein
MASGLQERLREHRRYIHPVVFPFSAVFIIAFVVFGVGFATTAEHWLSETLAYITATFGWLMILAVAAFLSFCVWLALSHHGQVRLGPDDSRPRYRTITWFAMLFSAGMGIGLLFWGVAEPVFHYADAPRVDSETPAAARDAMVLSFHHWGLGPWAVYAVLGLSLAYFGFRHDLPLTIRSALYPLIGERTHGWIGHVVDILAVVATMFGIATSLGLGAMQISAGLDFSFGTPSGLNVQILIIAVITVIATISVFSGLDRGIRRLSQANILAAAGLLVFVAAAGPTVLLLSAYVDNLGGYITNFADVLFWSGAYGGQEWLGEWTIFYWAWWISWSPFVGMFIARISRGRTIREFILGVLLVPAAVSFLWFTVMGNTALDLQLRGVADLVGPTFEDESYALFVLLEQLPFELVTALVAVAVIATFFVTSSDSGSFVIDMIASGGELDPPRSHRVFWAVAEGAVASALLIAGGLEALQSGAVSTGLPFTIVLLVVMFGLWKGLRGERAGVPFADIPATPLIGRVEGGHRSRGSRSTDATVAADPVSSGQVPEPVEEE